MIISINKLNYILASLLFLWILSVIDIEPTVYAMDNEILEGKLENYLTEHEETASGLATIVINEEQIIRKTRGYEDKKKESLVNSQTVFEWGSISKILVWISILQLVEDGRLELEIDIETYLPENFQTKATFNQPVTLRHLMNHSAGFDDSYTDLIVSYPTKNVSLRSVLEEANVKQVFPPGQVVAYSNYGASLAAYIVEEVSGLDYREYVKKHIFEPLHMTKTAIDPNQNDNDFVREQREKVQGYTGNLELIEPNTFAIPMYPSGSVIGVATDLEKLLQLLLSEDGLPLFKKRNTIEFFFQPSLNYSNTQLPRIANGLFSMPSIDGQVFGHGGNTIAFSSSIYLNRKKGIGVLVMTNQANESTFTLGIPEIIFDEYPSQVDYVNLENSNEWVGVYEPARSPHHGFSKIYGLFLRSKSEQSGEHNIMIGDLHYRQLEPGIYLTKDYFINYALDVYFKNSQNEKMLSSASTDLIYIPYRKHIFEWISVIVAGIAIVFSIVFTLFALFQLLMKKVINLFTAGQHMLNILLGFNIIWISYKTFSMTTYESIKPFLTFNVLYMTISTIICGILLIQIKAKGLFKWENLISILTILATILLCLNILYWEFYY